MDLEPFLIRSYQNLATVYDEVMSHVDYNLWKKLINSIHNKYKIPSNDILELGGGTGSLAYMFADTEWNWVHSDVSLQMVEVAQKKLVGGKNISCLTQDMRNLAIKKNFGLTVLLYDGINYMLSKEDFGRCLSEVNKTLLPGGYFLFDITTERNSITHFYDETFFEDFKDFCYVRHSHYDEVEKYQYNDFTIFIKKDFENYKRLDDLHKQRLYSIKEVESIMEHTGFKIIGIWDGYGFKKADQHSNRIHFLGKKK